MNTLQRRMYLNLALLGVAALLLLAVFYSPSEPTRQATRLLAMDESSIDHLQIDRPGQIPIELQRTADDWRMLTPYSHPANRQRIDALLRVSRLASLNRIVPGDTPLRTYQLDPPAVTLIINRQQPLYFGGQTPLDQHRYVMLDNTIHVVPDTLYYHLIGEPAALLAPQLLPTDTRIEALHLPGLSLQQHGGRWQSEPASHFDSADRIQAVIDAWRHAGVVAVRPYQGDEGETVRVVLNDGGTLQLLWIYREEERLLAHPEQGLEYHLSEASAREMLLETVTGK